MVNMRKFYLYYIFISLAWFAEQTGANFIINKVGSTNINLLNSNITNTSIQITVDGYEFIEVEDALSLGKTATNIRMNYNKIIESARFDDYKNSIPDWSEYSKLIVND